MDRGAWWATVHRVTKSQTQLSVQVFDEFQRCVWVCVCVCVCGTCMLSHAQLCPWNFSGKNTRVGLPFSTPGDLPDPRIEPSAPTL